MRMVRYRWLTVGVLLLTATLVVFVLKQPVAWRRETARVKLTSSRAYQGSDNALGIPNSSFLEHLRKYGLVDLPSKSALRKMSPSHLTWTYHSYIDNVNILCHRKLRMGRIGDGGWEICDDIEYRPAKPCIVYSFGINFDFTFDDDMAKVYGCEVFSFDPSMKKNSHQRLSSVQFLPLGIGGRDVIDNKTDWMLLTLSSIRLTLKHTERIIDVLKMDVEGSEWESLSHMIKSHDLSHVRQLLVEFHMYGEFKSMSAGVAALEVLDDLHALGFRKFYVHKNPGKNLKKHTFTTFRTPCYEVHFVNIKLKDVF